MLNSSEEEFNELIDYDKIQPKKIEDIISNLFNCLFSDNLYGETNFWEERYEEEDNNFDWFLNWNDLYIYIIPYLNFPINKTLNVGCGNSLMCNDMLSFDFNFIYNIDISTNLIKKLKKKYENNNKLIFEIMDCQELQYENDFFDLIIEKGTIDALYYYLNYKNLILNFLNEIERTLKLNCKFISISFANPKQRDLIVNFNSKIIYLEKILSINNYFCYIFIKK